MICRGAQVVAICASAVFLSACALHPESPISHSALSGVSGIEVLVPRAQPVEVKTLSGGVLQALGGFVTAPTGAYLDYSATKQMHERAAFPDFGNSLARNFAERAPKELSGWPTTTLVENAASTQAATNGAVVKFEIVNPWLTVIRGFGAEVTGTLTDARGKVLWKKYFWYRSYDFGRSGTQEDYLKDNYALLRAEIELAARDTAGVMLRDLAQGMR